MMEIDTHSPSSRMTHALGCSLKRPRSPGPSSQERQPKRPVLALEDGYLSLRAPSSFFPTSQSLNNRPNPEDWVRRASDLSIGTPLSSGSPREDDAQDESMALDLDEPAKSCPGVLVSSSPRLQAHPFPPEQVITLPTYDSPRQTTASSPSPSLVMEPADMRQLTPNAHILHQHQPPLIYSQLHTAPDRLSNQHEPQSEPPQSHKPFQTRTQVSPSRMASQYPGQFSSSGRKQRFTMGPRADCLKCRMGVKGHWMHFD